MTEYGRRSGSQPWDPEDPLYGDPGWHGQQAAGGQSPYGDQAQQYAQQQEPFAQQQYDWDGAQGSAAPYGGGPGDPYVHGQQPTQQQGQSVDPYGTGQHAQPYAPGQHVQPVDGYPSGQHGHPYGGERADYHGTPDGYPAPEQQAAPHGQHAQQQPAYQRQAGQEPAQQTRGRSPAGAPEGEPVDDWRAANEPDPGAPDHLFFAEEKNSFFDDADGAGRDGRAGRGPGRDEGRCAEHDDAFDAAYGDDVSDPREERRQSRERRNKKTKRRSDMACLVVTVVLGGVVGGVGYFGYQFWQSHLGAAPDFAGESTDEQVQIEIPEGTGVAAMGEILKREGVVKSSQAFVDAANGNPKGDRIQAGTYTLNKRMSGDAAVTMMTDPAALNSLIVTEGMRNRAVYAAIDKKIGAAEGTTLEVAQKEYRNLRLPAWANKNSAIKDPLEGFLYPSRYSVGKDAKPAAVLCKMVEQANKEYEKLGIDEAKAESLGLASPLDIVTVASLVNAEGMTHDDFRKMADVVYNRLKPDNVQTNGLLEFDSTYNYIKNQSKIDLTIEELRKYDNPYNTYHDEGLPPGPIGNPGEDALKATLKPERGGWYYFISVDLKTTKFTKTYAEHKKLVDEFNKTRGGGN